MVIIKSFSVKDIGGVLWTLSNSWVRLHPVMHLLAVIFLKSCIADLWLGSKHAFGYSKLFVKKKSNQNASYANEFLWINKDKNKCAKMQFIVHFEKFHQNKAKSIKATPSQEQTSLRIFILQLTRRWGLPLSRQHRITFYFAHNPLMRDVPKRPAFASRH